MRVNVYSTKPDGSCGIGIYTQKLIDSLDGVNLHHVTIDRNIQNPLYYVRKANELSKDTDLTHVQFEYDFMGRKPITSFYTPLFYTTLHNTKVIIMA